MKNKLTFTGGEPNMNIDDFLRIQKANRDFLNKLAYDYGNCIISGCNHDYPGANDILLEKGYVYLNSEILSVDEGIYTPVGTNTFWEYQKVTTYETGGNKTFLDGTPRQTWQVNKAVPVSVASISPGGLDCVNGERLYQKTSWANPTVSSVMASYPTSTVQVRKIREYLEIAGKWQGTGAPGAISTLMTLPSGYYEKLSKVIRFTNIATSPERFEINILTGVITCLSGANVTGASTYYFNVKLPY